MSVTMSDVARHVGVSKQTISAVINGKPGISADTIARVKQAIAELGYQPNLVASSLRLGYTKSIGLLLSNVANPWFAEIARGVEDVALARGYSVMLCNTYDDPDKLELYLNVFIRQRTAGVIGISANDAAKIAHATSCVFQSLNPINSARGAYVATAHLLSLGHRRIGCITALPNNTVALERLQGYRAALADWNIVVDENMIISGDFDYASGLRAAEQLLRLPTLPTAVFAHQDLLAIGIIAGLQRAGIRVPEDIAIVGYDGLEIASVYNPPLSTIIQPTHAMGMQAMRLLADKLEGKTSDETEPLHCQLAVRRSTVPTLAQEWISPDIDTATTPWLGWQSSEDTLPSRIP
ncbi:LacI family transcriptional regulator [Dictyobacter sp. S3.2.2.5]|uniref:LacI family transcriptional regulator n=1 Tax=Dictyobacter halimunensis TaxID=3026934 RepID=A0ABQ6FLV3_9CHLR|nr:LacI family transcriptional regulator [Dictyobacter sp. S3.2.2.5]